jgi:hypothetical protein
MLYAKLVKKNLLIYRTLKDSKGCKSWNSAAAPEPYHFSFWSRVRIKMYIFFNLHYMSQGNGVGTGAALFCLPAEPALNTDLKTSHFWIYSKPKNSSRSRSQIFFPCWSWRWSRNKMMWLRNTVPESLDIWKPSLPYCSPVLQPRVTIGFSD